MVRQKLLKGNTARPANVSTFGIFKQEIPLLGIKFYRNIEKCSLKKKLVQTKLDNPKHPNIQINDD